MALRADWLPALAAFESAARSGGLCLSGGGLSSAGRIRSIFDNQVNVLCCTPTYAMRLAEVAAAEKIDLAQSPVKLLIVAGESGGSSAGCNGDRAPGFTACQARYSRYAAPATFSAS